MPCQSIATEMSTIRSAAMPTFSPGASASLAMPTGGSPRTACGSLRFFRFSAELWRRPARRRRAGRHHPRPQRLARPVGRARRQRDATPDRRATGGRGAGGDAGCRHPRRRSGRRRLCGAVRASGAFRAGGGGGSGGAAPTCGARLPDRGGCLEGDRTPAPDQCRARPDAGRAGGAGGLPALARHAGRPRRALSLAGRRVARRPLPGARRGTRSRPTRPTGAISTACRTGGQRRNSRLAGAMSSGRPCRRGPAVGSVLREVEAWWIGEDFTPDEAALRKRLQQMMASLQ